MRTPMRNLRWRPWLDWTLGGAGVGMIFFLFGLIGWHSDKSEVNAPPAVVQRHRLLESLAKLPLNFIENQGQFGEEVRYYLPGGETHIYFTNSGVVFSLSSSVQQRSPSEVVPRSVSLDGRGADLGSEAKERQRWIVKLEFVGANEDVRPVGQDRISTRISYFKGFREEWKVNVPSYSSLVYPNLWPGIDLVYKGTAQGMKSDFIVHPGAEPDQIRLAYRGATEVKINDDGQMEVITGVGSFSDGKPDAYQDLEDQRETVDVAYTLMEEASEQGQVFQLRTGSYRPDLPLVIDPTVTLYHAVMGGMSTDEARAVAVDGSGNAYITGYTLSDEFSFPVTVGPDLSSNGLGDAFVAKINAAGTALEYTGYIGGHDWDIGQGVAVDAVGSAYVTGDTYSNSGFPVTMGPDTSYNGRADSFVAKIDPSGTTLEYAGYIGGPGDDYGTGIAVDAVGSAYVTGYTYSNSAFPVTIGPDTTHNGLADAFVAKINPAGTALDYAGYIGGAANDYGHGIAVDDLGNAYVTGETQSSEASFPVVVGPDLTLSGAPDAFVTKVNSSGAFLEYSGFLGGAGWDSGAAIAVGSDGSAYIAGSTGSDETTFPVLVGPDLTFNGNVDAFVAKVQPGGVGLVYAGFIGGLLADEGTGMAVDSAGNAYVSGWTFSDETTFPVFIGPDLTFNVSEGPGGGFPKDAFAARVNASGSTLDYSGYLGGPGYAQSTGSAVDSEGNATFTGSQQKGPVTFGTEGGLGALSDHSYLTKIFFDPVPIVADDSVQVTEDSENANIDVLANDPGAGQFNLSVSLLFQPANGNALVNPDNSVNYTPDKNFTGQDQFKYSVTDDIRSDVANVTITVTPVNDPPVAQDDQAVLDEWPAPFKRVQFLN